MWHGSRQCCGIIIITLVDIHLQERDGSPDRSVFLNVFVVSLKRYFYGKQMIVVRQVCGIYIWISLRVHLIPGKKGIMIHYLTNQLFNLDPGKTASDYS